MPQAYRLVVYLFTFTLVLVSGFKSIEAGENAGRVSIDSTFTTDLRFPEFSTLINFNLNPDLRSTRPYPPTFVEYSPVYTDETELSLYEGVTSKLGIPYRNAGTDDRGYDCSGFIWRVFFDAGIFFERSSARTLWQALPEANEEQATQFGTLVFFKGLNHVGIVRDSHSFYHASTSQGIVRSYFDDYWKDRVIGYRRVFAPVKKKAQINTNKKRK
jgi:hypothetical protein